MKVCKKCGAYNGDERTFCIDCAEALGKPVSGEEEQAIQEAIRQKTEGLYNGEDPLYVNLFDKILGVFSLAGLLVSLVVLIGGLYQSHSPRYIWIALICFFVAALGALVPRLLWELEELRLSFYTDSATPGGTYRILRRVGETVGFGLGVASLLVGWFNL